MIKKDNNWQQVALSATFAILLMIVGWLYSSYNERQKALSDEFNDFKKAQYALAITQNADIAVLQSEIGNLKSILARIEDGQNRNAQDISSKLDRIIKR